MKKSLLISILLHTLCFAIIFMQNSNEKSNQIINNPPCTVPIDIVSINDISSAPISKPKTSNLRAKEKKRSNVKVDKKDIDVTKDIQKDVQKDIKKDIPKKEPQKKAVKPIIEEKKGIIKELNNNDNLIEDIFKTEDKKIEIKKQDKKKDKVNSSTNTNKKKVASEKGEKNKGTDDEDFMHVLKDLNDDKDNGSSAETPITDPNSKSSYGAGTIGNLSISTVDRVRRQLESCWRIPLSHSGKLVVAVRLEMNPDATVRKATIIHSEGTPSHPSYDTAAENALRAVYHPNCNPLLLPLDQYEIWKVFTFRFMH